MKTVLVTSFHPHISRNVLRTSFLKRLSAGGNVRIVVAVPDYKRDFFEKILAGEQAAIEPVRLHRGSGTQRGLVFKRLAVLLMHSRTARIKKGFKYRRDRKLAYYLAAMLLGLVGAMRPVRTLYRFLDARLSPRGFGALFAAYQPALVFAADVQNENDVAILQEARRRGIPTVGMVRSWDNATQQVLRVLPDMLCVGSEALAEDMAAYQDVPADRIRVVGVPHYDRYIRGPREGRPGFFSRWRLDPKKPLLMYAPCGDKFIVQNDLDQYVMEVLRQSGHQVIVRFPTNDTVRLENFEKGERMRYDEPGVAFAKEKGGDREIGDADDERLLEELAYGDVVITGPSTIALDAILFDKPVILANFFAEPRPFWRRSPFFGLDHLSRLMATGATPMPRTRAEFEDLLAAYLADPARDRDARERAREMWLSHSLDGRAGERLAQAVVSVLSGIRP